MVSGRRPGRARCWPRSGTAARWRAALEDVRLAAARAALQVVFLASDAYERLHAIVVTLVRVGFTHERLLEWETAAATARRGGAAAPRRVRDADDGQPAHRRRRRWSRSSLINPRALARRVAAAGAVGGGARDRVPAQPAGAVAARGPRCRRPRVPAGGGAQDLALLRGLRRRRPTTRCRPTTSRLTPDPTRRASHVADQHRDGAARHGLRARSGLHRARRHGRAARRDADDGRASRALRGPPAQLVRHRRRCCRSRRGTSRPWTAAISPARSSRWRRRCRDSPRSRPSPRRPRRGSAISARRAGALFDAMDFRPLYDARRQLFAHRLSSRRRRRAPAGSMPRATICSRPKRAWRAFSPSPRATFPSRTGFISAVPSPPCTARRRCCRGPATLFEYLMPLLLTRTFSGTLLDQSCRLAIRRHIDYAARRGAPWGISESAYSAVDRHGTYQYKAFGVPGLGLKRGLGDELVVAPYASALAAHARAGRERDEPAPPRRARPRRRLRLLRRHRLHGPHAGRRRADRERRSGRRPHLHGASPGHDAGRAGQRPARRPHGRAVSRRPARPGDRTAASGTPAARGAGARGPDRPTTCR